ncbi:hypothetical protein DLAC_01386 [Tieghemostelium lacteum]|uniref:Uncharacterized protein n=1 Tax=Tieghemostelium lacteum TaxID=361077 RepID=A0A152A8T5_TIELA|nr:hypothetical protein DLAC_01386 [Tieghemostelium lacteum]|eukprot:KYR02541.1 hypothetical protein DLAC_01386 [Tieghemostelium lacteum]
MKLIKKLICITIILLVYLKVSESVETILAFNSNTAAGKSNQVISFDLINQNISIIQLNYQNKAFVLNVLEMISPSELIVFYENRLQYQYGTLYLNNGSISQTSEPLDNLISDFYTNLPIQYGYGSENIITLSGNNGHNYVVYLYWDLSNGAIQNFTTEYTTSNQNPAISCATGNNMNVTSFFFTRLTNTPTLLITNLATEDTTAFIVEGIDPSLISQLPKTTPIQIQDQYYLLLNNLNAIQTILYQIEFSQDNIAYAKVLYQAPSSASPGAQAIISEDQENIIFMGGDYSRILVNVYNIQSQKTTTYTFENTIAFDFYSYLAYLAY